ncbi:MAG: hypothetical protein EON60_02485 [Alphaproteobacteria bacterium]|nr:MAG: hypothetical protein EON60_02485 [Alphaproteobacteria bacterium]
MKIGFGKAGSETGKLDEIKQRLAALVAAEQKAAQKVGGGETIADDGVIPADKQTQIASDEALVREVLRLFGADYEALIAMDGESVYSNAVKADPSLLQDVLGSERPVLAALRVAMGYKPVAEFIGKYGSSPDDIKAAMRAEFEAEMAAKEDGKKLAGPVFSSKQPAARAPVAARKGKLTDVFGK